MFCCKLGEIRKTYVANGVLLNVDAILEDTLGARLTRSGLTACGDNLVWGGLHIVLIAEVEELLALLPLVAFPLVLPVLVAILDVLVLVGCGSSKSDS